MSKGNLNQHIAVLKRTTAEKEAIITRLQTALAELGYCHEQQANFITNNASDTVSTAQLFEENKFALAEAIKTNASLTDDLEFQAYRYADQQKRVGQLGKTCAEQGRTIESLKDLLFYARLGMVSGWLATTITVLYAAHKAGWL